MSVWAVCLVRDEADILRDSLLHMLDQNVDGILAIDRMSSDGSRDILGWKEGPGKRILVQDWTSEAFYQGARMTEACEWLHRHHAAEWIIPFDCDELWRHSHMPLADALLELPTKVTSPRLAQAHLYHHYRTTSDPDDGSWFHRMQWRGEKPSNLPKYCIRWQPNMRMLEGNHGVHPPQKHSLSAGFEVRHFPYRSEEQFIRKVISGSEALSKTNLPQHTGAHWRMYGDAYRLGGEDELRRIFREGFLFTDPAEHGLVLDPVPEP